IFRVNKPGFMRPSGLEPPRTVKSTRPSTRSRGCRWVQGRPNRPICGGFWAHWTGLEEWMFSKMFSRNGRGRVVGGAGGSSSLWVCGGFSEGIERSGGGQRAAAGRGRTQAVFYRDGRGREPVDDFLERLLGTHPLAAAKIDAAIDEHLNGRDPSGPHPSFRQRRRSRASCESCGCALRRPGTACSTSAPAT